MLVNGSTRGLRVNLTNMGALTRNHFAVCARSTAHGGRGETQRRSARAYSLQSIRRALLPRPVTRQSGFLSLFSPSLQSPPNMILLSCGSLRSPSSVSLASPCLQKQQKSTNTRRSREKKIGAHGWDLPLCDIKPSLASKEVKRKSLAGSDSSILRRRRQILALK